MSVITSSTSAWCETMYNLISLTAPPNQKPVSTSSPTTFVSSSCSSSTSSSVASLSNKSWKQSVIEVAAAISKGKLEVMDDSCAGG